MKKIFLIGLTFTLFLSGVALAQKNDLVFMFSAVNISDNTPLTLDSIHIKNLTRGCDITLLGESPFLRIDQLSGANNFHDSFARYFEMGSGVPNPASGISTVMLTIHKKTKLTLLLADSKGQKVAELVKNMDCGIHSLKVSMDQNQVYFLHASDDFTSKSIKIINTGTATGVHLEVQYFGPPSTPYKSSNKYKGFEFLPGDQLLIESFAKGFECNTIQDKPSGSKIYTFLLKKSLVGIPCPGAPVITWQGQSYNTVLIGEQCWMAENLNVGDMIFSYDDQTNNGTIEKYCYNNSPENCKKYGALYQWDEIMEYEFSPGKQGICPDGWHIPKDEEWKILEGSADFFYGVGDEQWDMTGQRGSDIGIVLKKSQGWGSNSHNNENFYFNALPAGIFHYAGWYQAIGTNGRFWTSNQGVGNGAWYRSLNYGFKTVYRNNHGDRDSGFSLRCVKDDE